MTCRVWKTRQSGSILGRVITVVASVPFYWVTILSVLVVLLIVLFLVLNVPFRILRQEVYMANLYKRISYAVACQALACHKYHLYTFLKMVLYVFHLPFRQSSG